MIIGFGLAFWGLVQQNRELRALIDSRPSQIPDLAVGDLITPINLVAVHNAAIDFEEMISAGGVIAFLTTTCPICETSLPFWQDLSAELDGKAILFVGISLHSPNLTEQYIETHGISWPVLAAPDPTPLLRLGVTGVPLTIAIKPGGEVPLLKHL